MIPFTGYSLLVQYTGIVDEHTAHGGVLEMSAHG